MRLFIIIITFLIAILFISCEKNDFELSESADEIFFLRNDGADLPVWVRGNTASKTMIVYLHGGPTGVGSFFWDTQESYFIQSLIRDYALVFYEQRGTSSSQGNFDGSFMTEEQFVDDLDKLITLIYSKYGSDIHVFLYGLSWGGYLGTAYITSHDYQYKIKGWINDSGNHNQLKAANDGKEMLINYAQQQISLDKNKDEWSEILNWCEQNDTILDLPDFAQWSNYAIKAERLMNDSTVSTFHWDSKVMRKSYFNSPYSASSVFSNNLFNHYIAGNYKTLNLSEKLYKVEIPVLLVRGKYDFSVPVETIDEAFEKINSIIKYKKSFDKSGHSVGDGETDLFINMIDDFIEENI